MGVKVEKQMIMGSRGFMVSVCNTMSIKLVKKTLSQVSLVLDSITISLTAQCTFGDRRYIHTVSSTMPYILIM